MKSNSTRQEIWTAMDLIKIVEVSYVSFRTVMRVGNLIIF